jgi:type IV pilus assembly protein PilW
MTMTRTIYSAAGARSAPRESNGFGLVELMISIAIGLVIIAALVTLFVNTSRNNREMATANSVIENGRFAIDLLENEVVHAGYWSTYVPDYDDPTIAPETPPTSTPLAVPDPCAAFDAGTWVEGSALVNELIGIPIQVIPDGSAVCNAVIQDRVAGTDAIVIRHAGRCVPGEGTCPADDPAALDLFIQASLCVDEIDAGNLYVFGRNTEETFPLHRRNCTTPAEKRRFESYIYYVRDYAADPDDGIPTLVRSEFRLEGGTLAFRAPVPMVEGVDGLWAELGIDDVSITGALVDNSAPLVWDDPDTKTRATNRGDSVPDEFVRCTTDPATCTAAQLQNVTAVQMYVLARSREATRGYTDTKAYSVGAAGNIPAFNDGFKRHVYSTTVRLHNIAGRRIRPGDEEAP